VPKAQHRLAALTALTAMTVTAAWPVQPHASSLQLCVFANDSMAPEAGIFSLSSGEPPALGVMTSWFSPAGTSVAL